MWLCAHSWNECHGESKGGKSCIEVSPHAAGRDKLVALRASWQMDEVEVPMKAGVVI